MPAHNLSTPPGEADAAYVAEQLCRLLLLLSVRVRHSAYLCPRANLVKRGYQLDEIAICDDKIFRDVWRGASGQLREAQRPSSLCRTFLSTGAKHRRGMNRNV